MDLVQRNRVKTLDALLSSGQAQVLNELLVWVAGLSYQPSTKLLESVLFLTSGEEFLLADQIATTYSPVLPISKEGDVGFKDGLRDILSASGTSDSESALTQLHDEAITWQAIEPYQLPQVSVADTGVPSAGDTTKTSAEASYANGVPTTPDKKSEVDSDASSSTTAKTKAYISGYICDGGCGTEWENVLADCHVCKHCLCVQFCSACYKKLQAGDLHPLICNQDHKMLFLPPFDWDAWRTMPTDMMIMDKQLVPRREWVDRIRKEYDVQQEQIDMTKLEKAKELKAASVIAVRWRSRLKKIRDKNTSTAPTLRRVKTVW
ncbi:uncharacterized protein ALTATR162_LOCUS5063 [Alternaria atra]|uniref:Uncharacterized protein n=1 Tax=Alternaria atra TaxID=119953 RepID=A0A8J2I2F8_9PLEO|nr:uncharacterized protein ALTATR162_LOCUS5063 [Alternaria atra]CAG5158407.1 unnamed protein product [Alternaria atra]